MNGKSQISIDYFLEILDLHPDPTKQEIKQAYRIQIKKWHPDKFPAIKEEHFFATEKSKLIIEAYSFLKDYVFTKIKNGAAVSAYQGQQNIVRVRVKSSNIHSAGFDELTNILQIEFLNGGIYEYSGVPAFVFLEFMRAPSKGKFANKYIFFTYPYITIV